MTPDPAQFNLPQHIMDKLKDKHNGVKADVVFALLPHPGYEVTVTDKEQVIYTCARPCPLKQ